jgi:dihydroxyacetone kinase-like predicted kinase
VGHLRGPAGGRTGAGPPRCGAIAVASGEGLHALFHGLGVHTIEGGPKMNPSTYDLLAAIHEVPAEEVVLLPNSANVIMAAEHAARLSEKQVLVARTTSQQAGLVAAVALADEQSVEQNAQALDEALSHVRTGAVAPAARDDAQGRFRAGEAVGFVDEEVLAWGEPAQTLRAVLAQLSGSRDGLEPPELISVLEGAEAPIPLAEVQALVDSAGDAELELRHGGQSAYWWLLAAE